MMIQFGLFAIGLIILYYGGEWLVDGSCELAKRFHIRPFVIGAIVIGFGTSAPEAFVSVTAQLQDSSGISLGNIVGSSICNIGLILGIVAVMRPVVVDEGVVKWEFPVLAIATIALVVFSFGEELKQWNSIVFLILFGLFLTWSLMRRVAINPPSERDHSSSLPLMILKIVIGITALVLGSEFLVRSAIEIARVFGVSELVIGTSAIAVGTSLPELAAAVIAASRKESGLIMGNIIGSNVFNLLFVSGLALSIKPIPVDSQTHNLLLPALVIFTFALFPSLKAGNKIGRNTGYFLLSGYAVFTVFLFAFQTSS